MLRSIKSMDGHKILAENGEIGRISDFYFDDESWVVRYLVVNTGNWLVDKKVLISPTSFVDTDWHRREISVSLTKEQIEKSPDVSHDKPVFRQKEAELAKYYTWPTYWPIGGTAAPMHEAAIAHTLKSEAEEIEEREDGDEHLRSAHEVMKYSIHATDGDIGHVDDLIVDDTLWNIRYLVVNTRKLLPGRKVLVSPEWIELISWSEHKVNVQMDKESIKNSPPFDPSEPINRTYEEHLYDFYGRPKYWK